MDEGLENKVAEILTLWNTQFVKHMGEKAKKEFPEDLRKIKKFFYGKNYENAKKIIDENYKWALHNLDTCEVSPIGFNYATMKNYFSDLGKIIDNP